MKNKKIISKWLIASILLFNTPTDVIANTIEDYQLSTVDKKENKFEEFFNNLFDKFKKPKEVIKVNKNIKVGTVLDISLKDGEYVPTLEGNINGYETVRVTTIGEKKLMYKDYVNLRNSGIPKVDLSNSQADYISSEAFKDAVHLVEFKFPQGITNISGGVDSGAFQGCVNLSGNLVIPDTVTSIYAYAFYGCKSLTGDLIIPDSVTSISQSAFEGCTGFNGTLKLPNSLEILDISVFKDCSGFTGDLIIPNSVTSIYAYAFKGCYGFNGELKIPNSVTDIKVSAFENCSGLTGDLIIPNSIKYIDNYIFRNCSGFNGKLVIPNSVTKIYSDAFEGCSGFTEDILIPDSVKSLGSDVFAGVASRIIIKVNENDLSSNYKEEIIIELPDTAQTVIDLPYDFDIKGTWLENTNKTIGKPVIKNITNDIENELNNGSVGTKVSLYIPATYQESNVVVSKDDMSYDLPSANSEKKHIFTENGSYDIKITTELGNISNISFIVENIDYNIIEETINQAQETQNPEDIEAARDLVNKLPESSKKDEFQGMIDAIFPNIEFKRENITSNIDIYIKSENILSLSLNTNMITFDDFSGINDDEKLNAVSLTVDSSLPYELNAYLPTEIYNSDKTAILNKEIFNIRENNEGVYKHFTETNNKLVLKDNNESGDDIVHKVDLKLKGGLAHKKDIYKVTIKFEIQQK